MSMKTVREITTQECPWLDDDIPEGTEVFLYHGCTYGCISSNGIAVSLVEGQVPFFQVPTDSVE